MHEHGILKRVLLVYGEAGRRLEGNQDLPPEPLAEAARIIRSFIEDYHEKLEEDFRGKLADSLQQFIRMYHPHEAREDTVLFPALRKLVTPHEYGALGEEFEKKEHELFGEDGFEKMVDRVADIEKALDIYDLRQFTPKG